MTAASPTSFPRLPRSAPAGTQDSMPSRYSRGVRLVAMAAFIYVVAAYLNARVFHLLTGPDGEPPVWLSQWTEYVVIIVFGAWRVAAERNPYTRKRLAFLVTAVGVLWWIVPDYLRLPEPFIGALPGQPIFPQIHTPGTLTFFAVLLLVLLFGRRVVCGWNCPCVGIRETVGFAFRERTPRSDRAWRWRHLKWAYFVLYVGVTALILIPGTPGVSVAYRAFLGLVALPYFATFLLSPWIGNRSYCRFLCPYGATFGLLNRIGFFRVKLDQDRCIDCGRCEQVCDMGIPVMRQGRQAGEVRSIEECMGCGRCVVSCPTDALSFRDVRDIAFGGAPRNASRLLGRSPLPAAMPVPAEADDIATARADAARCLDCGEPACRAACPLHNRIPDWLAALAAGDDDRAAQVAHETSPFPELCGRLCPHDRLCEGACARGQVDAPVAIGRLETLIADKALERGWRPEGRSIRPDLAVAIIGAGPAGLACADALARAGARVTVWDGADEAGGQLSSAIPSFKLARHLSVRRRQVLEMSGVSFHLVSEVAGDDMAALLDSHDAVFIATGASRSRSLAAPGAHLQGVLDALAYLRGRRPLLANGSWCWAGAIRPSTALVSRSGREHR